ncbi:MAG: hypothetical protein U0Q55_07630 [Vicinamibacterales bacterium]
MAHLDEIVGRLPQLYRDGTMVRGVLGAPAVQIEVVDQIMRELQRAHWFETTLNLDEAARIAGVLDIAPEPWQTLATYRGWVTALRDARLREGSVTPRALQVFVAEYVRAFVNATRERVAPDPDVLDDATAWSPVPAAFAPALVENPKRRVLFTPSGSMLEPLAQFTVQQRGIDPAMPTLLFIGTPAAGESGLVLVNTTTGHALSYAGVVDPGQRLWLTPAADGTIAARLEDDDTTHLLRSIEQVTPGQPWAQADEVTPPRAMTLVPGANQLWFLPLARYDVRGLDRATLAMPDLSLMEGRWDSTAFDTSVFFQEPGVMLRMGWREAVPASFEIQLPSQCVPGGPHGVDGTLEARAQLGDALDAAVNNLRAAGVASRVVLRQFFEAQGQRDRLAMVLPKMVAERGSVGADRLLDAGGVFEVTRYDDSTYR